MGGGERTCILQTSEAQAPQNRVKAGVFHRVHHRVWLAKASCGRQPCGLDHFVQRCTLCGAFQGVYHPPSPEYMQSIVAHLARGARVHAYPLVDLRVCGLTRVHVLHALQAAEGAAGCHALLAAVKRYLGPWKTF